RSLRSNFFRNFFRRNFYFRNRRNNLRLRLSRLFLRLTRRTLPKIVRVHSFRTAPFSSRRNAQPVLPSSVFAGIGHPCGPPLGAALRVRLGNNLVFEFRERGQQLSCFKWFYDERIRSN